MGSGRGLRLGVWAGGWDGWLGCLGGVLLHGFGMIKLYNEIGILEYAKRMKHVNVLGKNNRLLFPSYC